MADFMPGVCSMFEPPIRTLLLPGERNHLEGLSSPPGPSQSAGPHGPHLHLSLPGGQDIHIQIAGNSGRATMPTESHHMIKVKCSTMTFFRP